MKDVEPTVTLDRFADQRAHVVLFTDVGRAAERASAGRGDRFGYAPRGGRVEVADRNRAAFLREPHAGRSADAACAAHDDRDFVAQSAHDHSLLHGVDKAGTAEAMSYIFGVAVRLTRSGHVSRSLDGKAAFVTGASQGGTGRAVAVRFAAEGARVGFTARSVDGLQETLDRIKALGGTGLAMPCDLSDPAGGRDTLIARTEEAFGPIDVLVNNAVAHTLKPVHEFTIEELESYAQCNLWAPWLHMSQVIPGMRERGRGWILNLTSFSAELPPGPPFARKAKDGSSMYGATKAALNRLTVAAAGENEGVIAVNALTPQIAMGNAYNSPHVPNHEIWEPVETMVEAGFALLTGDPAVLTGRIAYSLQLIVELQLPVYDFANKELMEGWQPADIFEHIKF